jgi:membrane protease YdiL (CAAX protease family)
MAIAELTRVEAGTRRKSGLRAFFTMTFALTWGIAAILIAAPDAVERVFGPIGLTNPLYVLAVYAPAFSGMWMVWRHHGTEGLRSFFRRFAMFRMPVWGWLLLVVGIPVIVYAGAFASGTAGDTPVFSPWYTALPILGQLMFLAGTVEEIGWRGVALPLLQRRFNPLVSGLVLGVAWATWHLPAFAMSGTIQSAWSFGPYFVGLLAVSVIVTSLFNASNGSIAIAWLMHFQLMNPLFPDAQPWDTLFYVVAAALVVFFDRRRMLGRSECVVDVLHPTDDEASLVGAGRQS